MRSGMPCSLLPSRTPFAILPRMEVLALTILVSVCLAGIFIACFAAELRRGRHSSPERDSLLPLDDSPAAKPIPATENSSSLHDL